DAYVQYETRTIRVTGSSVNAKAAVFLAHEVGHVEADNAEYQRHRGAMETEAESVAYIVAAAHGLDPAQLSVPYVAGWGGQAPARPRGAPPPRPRRRPHARPHAPRPPPPGRRAPHRLIADRRGPSPGPRPSRPPAHQLAGEHRHGQQRVRQLPR